MWIFAVLSWITKLTRGTDFDDKLVEDLRLFFLANPKMSGSIFQFIKDGVKNGFDFDDEAFTERLIEILFNVIKTQAPQQQDLGSNKL